MPLQFLRGRLASTFGAPSDILNTFRSPMPMEMYGQTDYAPQQQVPYGSQELMRTLPLPPTSPAGQLAGNVGAVVPLSPAEILQAARVARQAALAGGKVAQKGARLVGEELNATMMGERPNTILGAITPSPKYMYVPASQEEAFQASKMLRKQTPQEVWNKTGVAKYGNDFVKEISDKNAVAGFTHLEGVNNGERLRELAFDNPQLYSLMPELKNFGQLGLRENKMSGSFQKVGDTGSLVGYAPNENDLKTVMAHEVQHGIQDLSGWERGGSTKDIALDIAENKLKAEEIASKLERMQNKASDEAKRANPDLIAQATQWANKTMPEFYANADKSKIVKDYLLQNDPIYASLYQNHADLAYNKPALLGAEETYKRLAGEVQARSTQNRVNLTDEQRRQFFPFELKSEANPYGLDVAPEDLVFRTQMGQNQLRKNPKAAMENQNQLRKPVNTFQYPQQEATTKFNVPAFHGTGISKIAYPENKLSEMVDRTHFPGWFTESPELANYYAIARNEGNPTVLPVNLNIKKPLKLNFDMNDRSDMAYEAVKKLGLDPEFYPELVGKNWAHEIVNTYTFKKAAQEAGYDAIQVLEDGHKTYAPLKESGKQVKSRFQK